MTTTTTMNEMNTMKNTTTTMKEEEKTMTTLTKERRTAIKRLKKVNTKNYYTDDVIDEIYKITSGLNIGELEECLEEIWDSDLIFEYIKDQRDLDSVLYRIRWCNPGAEYYRMNAYGNLEDWTAEDLDWLVKNIIETIEEAE